MTAITNTRQWRSQLEADKQAVLFFTGMTDAEYNDFKADMYFAWVALFCEKFDLKPIEPHMKEEPNMLRWWNLEWRRFDHFYILPTLHQVAKSEREDFYKKMHSDVFREHHPEMAILEQSISDSLDKVDFKKENNHEEG
jgi:hypothetical protein